MVALLHWSPPLLPLPLLLLLSLPLLQAAQTRGGGQEGGSNLPLCREGDEDPPCFHPAPEPMGWGSAHGYCRGLGGFLAGRGQSGGLGGVWSDPSSPLTWTSLTPHHGHYQWLSQCPGGSGPVKWRTAAPQPWRRDCAAYDVATQEFRLHPCTDALPFYCFLHHHHQHQHQHQQQQQEVQDLSDVQLVVEGSEVAGPYGWYNLSRQQFKDLTLTCRAYSRSTGRPLPVQPHRVFWSKDHVYINHCLVDLTPATLPRRTWDGSGLSLSLPGTNESSGEGAPPPTTNQGTYWCGAWDRQSTVPLQSDKVLITLDDSVVVIFQAHLNSTHEVSDVANALRAVFAHRIRNLNNRVLDPVVVWKEGAEEESEEVVVKYTFHLHMLKTDLNSQDLEEFDYVKFGNQDDYEQNEFLPSSTVSLPTFCSSEDRSFDSGGKLIKLHWPFSSAGDLYPTNHRCKVKYGKLKPGHCVWDYTNGAHLTFDPSGCEWTDLCPKGYTMLSDWLCMTLSKPGSWGTGINSVYKTGQGMSLLDHFSFLNTPRQRSGVYEFIRDLVRYETESDLIWLPVRRIRKFGPLNHLDTTKRKFRQITFDELEKFNVTWADGQPNGALACLAVDLAKKNLLTSNCHSHYPFVSIIKATFLKQSPSHSSSSLVLTSSFCDSGWKSTQLTEKLFCFKLFKSPQNLTWHEANAYCGSQNATLPSPNVGFLDWVYRKYLYTNGVPDVWMGARWRPDQPDRILYHGSVDHLNWLADTDYTKEYGVLNQKGWILVDENTTKTHVLCQQRKTPETKLHVELLKPEYEASQTMCIRAKPRHLLSETEDSNLQCFINGVHRRHDTRKSPNCPFELTVGNQGYYECYAWSRSPVELVQSNTILHEDHGTFTFLISLLHDQNYIPEEHDSTFEHAQSKCSDNIMKKINYEKFSGYVRDDENIDHNFDDENFSGSGYDYKPKYDDEDYYYISPHNYDMTEYSEESSNFEFTTMNLLYKPRRDSKLLENFHLKCKVKEIDSNYNEGEVLNTLRELLHARVKYSNCSLENIRSTSGCQREVTWNYGYNARNLTWPQTTRTAVVISEELCVTPEGEAVTRKCLGDFMLGYFWMEAGNCTGQPTDVTHQLWKIKNNPKSYLTRPSTNATAPALLPSLTSNSQALQPIDIHLIAKTFESFTHYNISPLDLDETVEIVNNVLGATYSTFEVTQMKLNSSAILLEAFVALTLKMKVPTNQSRTMSSSMEYISVERLALEANSTIVGYKLTKGVADGHEQKLLRQSDTLGDLRDAEVAIVFPKRLIFNLSSKLNQTLVNKPELQLTFAVFQNYKLFQDPSIVNKFLLNTKIIQATFKDLVVKDLKDPIKIYFKPLVRGKGGGGRCVFWDFSMNDRRGGWSGDGCREVEEEGAGDHEVCYCNHLTSFAHLINYSKDSGIEGIHEVILDVITIIGCCLSILGLVLIFFTFFIIKEWRGLLGNRIHVNLSFSIFLTVITFLFGIDRTWNVILCRTVAVALHYFILASFGWMLVEGVHLYLKIAKSKRDSDLPVFLKKALVCAWGLPLVPVVALYAYDPSIYDDHSDDKPTICWMSPLGFKTALLPPLVAMIVVNLALFSRSFYAATCGRRSIQSSASPRGRFINHVSLSICAFFLLGFTWFFGMMAVNESEGRLVFAYLFCISNSLQGIFLFILVRKHWARFFTLLTQKPATRTPRHPRNVQQSQVVYDKKDEVLSVPQGENPAQLRQRENANIISS